MKQSPGRTDSLLQSITTPEPEPLELKFIADANLGRLVTWLRILGYDTVAERSVADRDFLRRAQGEGRVVLTRKRSLAERQFNGRLLVIEHDRVAQQVNEVIEKFDLNPQAERFFSRCLRCNLILKGVRKGSIEKRVPEYVYLNSTDFRQCAKCRRVYWPGTHKEKACRFLTGRSPAHPL